MECTDLLLNLTNAGSTHSMTNKTHDLHDGNYDIQSNTVTFNVDDDDQDEVAGASKIINKYLNTLDEQQQKGSLPKNVTIKVLMFNNEKMIFI